MFSCHSGFVNGGDTVGTSGGDLTLTQSGSLVTVAFGGGSGPGALSGSAPLTFMPVNGRAATLALSQSFTTVPPVLGTVPAAAGSLAVAFSSSGGSTLFLSVFGSAGNPSVFYNCPASVQTTAEPASSEPFPVGNFTSCASAAGGDSVVAPRLGWGGAVALSQSGGTVSAQLSGLLANGDVSFDAIPGLTGAAASATSLSVSESCGGGVVPALNPRGVLVVEGSSLFIDLLVETPCSLAYPVSIACAVGP